MASDHIPEELWPEILKRLSVKTLIKFQCVSKSWNSLISSRFFTDHHFNFNSTTTTTEPPTYLRELCDYKASYVLHNQDNTTTNVDFPFLQSQLRVKFFEVIHGVVCLAYTLKSNYIKKRKPLFRNSHFLQKFIAFWNPTVRKLVSTSIPSDSESDLYKFPAFGFDISKNDFKAVWIPLSLEYCEVFSARDGKWRKKKVPEFAKNGFFRSYSCFVNGTIHWIKYTLQDSNLWYEARRMSSHSLLLFECEHEEFTTMDLPNVGVVHGGAVEVFVYRGLLSVLMYGWRGGIKFYESWTMNEYGVASTWTKTRIIKGTIISRQLEIAYKELDNHVMERSAYVFKESMLLMDIGETPSVEILTQHLES